MSALLHMIGLAIAALWLLLMVDGIWPHAQMLLTNGNVPIPSVALKGLLGLLLLGAVVLRGRLALPRGFILHWALFSLYLLAEALAFEYRFGYPPDYVFFSYNVMYFFLLITPLVFASSATLKPAASANAILWILVPLAILGLAQFFSGEPLVPTESADDYFSVSAWIFTDLQVRAFSLFTASLNFGHFIAFAAGIAMASWLSRRGLAAIPLFVLLLVAMAATYSTLTRTTYVEVAAVLVSSYFLLRLARFRRLILFLPVIYGAAAFVLLFGAPALSIFFSDSSTLLDEASLLMRIDQWLFYGALWLAQDLPTLLFGTGYVQNERFVLSDNITIDNLFLAVGVHIGIAGLVLWFGLIWWMWKHLLQLARNQPNPLNIGVTAFFSTYFLTGMFGIAAHFYALSFLLAVWNAQPLRRPSERTARKGSSRGALRAGGAVAPPA